ncbi:MAG: hypothetical protein ACRDHF_01190 [Tepidiformaceae bacterium]
MLAFATFLRSRCSIRAKLLIMSLGLMGLAGTTLALADHYGQTQVYGNSYIVGWNTETGYNAGETAPFVCGGVHFRHFSSVNIYGYTAYSNPYVNWVRLYDGETVGSSSWVYGMSYMVGDQGSVEVDSLFQSYYSDQYHFLFNTVPGSEGDVHLLTYVDGSSPDCAQTMYHSLDRVP